MIEKRTVFILGAGASCPYGFPDAHGLRREIITNFAGDYSLRLGGRDGAFDTIREYPRLAAAEELVEWFNRSSTDSIDLFLSRNPRLETIGKIAISASILEAENKSRFREQVEKQEHDWYFHLYNRLTSELAGANDFRQFSKSNMAFVTFNYDRSLEYFLFDSLLHSFEEANPDNVREQMVEIPIVHMYGQIGGLPWQEAEAKLKYGNQIDGLWRVNLVRIIDHLYVVHEERANPELERAREEISKAERIFFLGFGYAKENLEALGLPGALKPDQRIFGTAMGWKEKEIKNIKRDLTLALEHADTRSSNRSDQVEIRDCDCVALLREFL